MPRPYPKEFRDDVVAVARRGDAPIKQIAADEANRRIRLLEQENEVLRRAAAYLSQAHLPGKGSTRS